MESPQPGPDNRTLKFRQAGWGLLAMNLAYGLVLYWKLPPLGLDTLEIAGYSALLLVLSGILSWYVYHGARTLTVMLAAVYGGRAVFAGFQLWVGPVFPLVPWVGVTLVVAFYFLARAVWDWP